MKMMGLKENCTTLSIFFALFWGFCCGFVLISSASAGAGGLSEEHVFPAGSSWSYRYTTRVLLNEKDLDEKDVGFFIASNVLVESIWSHSYSRLLKITLKSPKLFIRSRKAPEPDGFTGHTSKLETLPNAPFYILWNRGKIEKLLLSSKEPTSLSNLKKGLASMFQFQLLDQEVNETDASGHCVVSYVSLSPTKFRKVKHSCTSPDLPLQKNPDLVLSATVTSTRTTEYELEEGSKYITKAQAEEIHKMYVTAKEEVGNKVEVHQSLDFDSTYTTDVLTVSSFDEALQKISTDEGPFTQETLTTEKENINYDDVRSFVNTVSEYRESLKSKHLGTVGPAKSFIQLVYVGKRSSKDDIAKALNSKKNQKILHQLYDVLGYVQTLDSHAAAMKKLHFDQQGHEDLSERYLWALSLSSHPHPEIVLDLISRYRKSVNIPDKVKETILLTVASMAHRLSKLPNNGGNKKVINTVQDTLINGFDAAKDEERLTFLRALRNLKTQSLIPTLLEIIKTGTSKEEVLAWKALRAMESLYWNKDVLDEALKTFYEQKHDSSARTLCVDIILRANPSESTLKDLLRYLLSDDKAFEVKQYVLQQIKMISEDCGEFKKRVVNIVKENGRINNYDILAQKGLSTALTRKFLESTSSNGSLLTIQEMYGGIVKRGIVDVVMDKSGTFQEIFSLGVFSGGLGGFLSSDSEEDSEEIATAGMELAILGTQIRPFVFFQGQGELMGHVWSGTASERTTAFQALALLQDHSEYLRLGAGFIAELDVKGATSFDLAGKIEFSLWNRNAESLVEKSAGFTMIGLIKVDTSFVRSKVEFSVSFEPKLHLRTDIDFYSGVNLCMRLTQPDSVFRHNIFKIERIPGSKHRLRKVKYKKYVTPGKTYALNKKNNDMCNTIFKISA